MSEKIVQNKKGNLKDLSENARRIVFLLVAVPGGKNIAMLREALGLDDGRKSYEVNVQTIRFCEELQRAGLVSFDPQNYSNNSKRMCRLKAELPLDSLAELAAEGTHKNWWPDRATILRFCRGIGFRTADSADKHWYEGQEDVLEGVAGLVRLLLAGEGVLLEKRKPE